MTNSGPFFANSFFFRQFIFIYFSMYCDELNCSSNELLYNSGKCYPCFIKVIPFRYKQWMIDNQNKHGNFASRPDIEFCTDTQSMIIEKLGIKNFQCGLDNPNNSRVCQDLKRIMKSHFVFRG